jgi:hypothetical protein
MPCYHPISAFQCADRSIVFDETRKHDIIRSLNLPCGRCVGCRLEKSKQWAIRVMHEASQHSENSFITLTYNDTHLPNDYSLHYKDFQLFVKRLRKRIGKKIRFYMAGEYGENYGRPHFHACIFGYSFPDKELWKRTTSDSFIYRSTELEALWPFGYSSIGDVTFESAAYVARYIMQKQNGDKLNPKTGKPYNAVYEWTCPVTGEIFERKPEFNKMSLKPGIGAKWLEKYESDVFPHDYVVIKGKKMKVPRYYDKIYASKNPYEMEEIQHLREIRGKLKNEDNSIERLLVKETVQLAKLRKLKRNLT